MNLPGKTCLVLYVHYAFGARCHGNRYDCGSSEGCKASVHDGKTVDHASLGSFKGDDHFSALDFLIDLVFRQAVCEVALLNCPVDAVGIDLRSALALCHIVGL